MNRLEEAAKENQRSHGDQSSTTLRTLLQRHGHNAGRIEPEAEEQPRRDCNHVEQYVANFADPRRNEPLEPLLQRADDEAGEDWHHDRRAVAGRTPRAVEERGDESVLDEVKALDGIDFRVA